MRFTSSLLPTLALIARALTIDITSNTISTGTFNTNWGDSSIAEGVYWSVIDNDFTNFIGDLDVEGELYVSCESETIGLNVNLGGINNKWTVGSKGKVVLNSMESQLTPFYNTKADTFTNDGEIWFAGNGDFGIPTMAITSGDWNNNNMIHFYQLYRSSGWVNLGWDLQRITNNGAVCLTKMAYRQATAIDGSGCFDIGEEATAWIAYSLQDISTDQTFIFSSTNGALKVDAYTRKQTFNVVGWGDDNVIGVGVPMDSWSYSEDGILTIKANALSSYDFNIGTGYDVSKIKQITPNFGPGIGKVINGGLIYQDSPVNTERPSTCPACKAVPEFPTEGSSTLEVSSSSETSAASSTASSSTESSTEVSSTEASSTEASSTEASSTEVSSTEVSSTEVSSTESSEIASSTEVSSTESSEIASSTEVSSAASESSDVASSTESSDVASSTESSEAASSTESASAEMSSAASSTESASAEMSSAASSEVASASDASSSIEAEYVISSATTIVTVTCTEAVCQEITLTSYVNCSTSTGPVPVAPTTLPTDITTTPIEEEITTTIAGVATTLTKTCTSCVAAAADEEETSTPAKVAPEASPAPVSPASNGTTTASASAGPEVSTYEGSAARYGFSVLTAISVLIAMAI